jgi:hypothetical protein
MAISYAIKVGITSTHILLVKFKRLFLHFLLFFLADVLEMSF